MDLALNNLQRLICHKTQPTNQREPELIKLIGYEMVSIFLKKKTWTKVKSIRKSEL